MADSERSGFEPSVADFQIAIHKYDGPIYQPERFRLIRYCLVGDIDQTEYSYEGDPSRVRAAGTDDPTPEQVASFLEQSKRLEKSVEMGEEWYKKARDMALASFSHDLASHSEQTAKAFLHSLDWSGGYREDWSTVEQEGLETAQLVAKAYWDQEKFTKLLTSRASWIIAICNDGEVRCKAPVEEDLKPLVSAVETSGLVPADHSESSTGSSI